MSKYREKLIKRRDLKVAKKKIEQRQRSESRTRKNALLESRALDFYSPLTKEAHELWEQIKKFGTEDDIEDAKQEVKRVLGSINFKIARRLVAQEVNFKGLEELETDEEILDKALELVND